MRPCNHRTEAVTFCQWNRQQLQPRSRCFGRLQQALVGIHSTNVLKSQTSSKFPEHRQVSVHTSLFSGIVFSVHNSNKKKPLSRTHNCLHKHIVWKVSFIPQIMKKEDSDSSQVGRLQGSTARESLFSVAVKNRNDQITYYKHGKYISNCQVSFYTCTYASEERRMGSLYHALYKTGLSKLKCWSRNDIQCCIAEH